MGVVFVDGAPIVALMGRKRQRDREGSSGRAQDERRFRIGHLCCTQSIYLGAILNFYDCPHVSPKTILRSAQKAKCKNLAIGFGVEKTVMS